VTKVEFLRLLETTLERDEGSLKGEETLADIDWDSLAVVSFLALADEHFGLQLGAKAVNACKTLPQVIALLGANVAG
jgi:acyl carrier protein